MTALTQEADRAVNGGRLVRLPLKASANPYAGSALSYDPTGYANELVAGQPFAGFARQTIPSVYAPAADGGGEVEAMAGIFLAALAVSGAAIDDVAHGRPVYASDDATFTFTAAGNTLVGYVVGLSASGIALVLCRTAGEQNSAAFAPKIRSVSSATTLTTADLGSTVFGDTQAGAFSITLPLAADCTGRSITFVRAGTGTNALTLDGAGTEAVDGATTSAVMDAARDTLTIQSDGTAWYVVASRVA